MTQPLDASEFVPPPPRADLLWVGIDLDGTLAHSLWSIDNPTAPIGDPIWDNVQKTIRLVGGGHKVRVHTSRPWSDYELIEAWLNYWEVPFSGIICGKPLFKFYIDDRNVDPLAPDWSDPLSLQAESWNAGFTYAIDMVRTRLNESA